jgi:hypothetical protein
MKRVAGARLMDVALPPVTLQLPSGYSFSTDGSPGQGSSASTGGGNGSSAANPVDTVSISNAVQAGSFAAEPGDVYRLSDLFQGSAPSGQAIAAYRVALDNGGDTNARLLLNGTDVSDRSTFTPDEFSDLTYHAGATGSWQSITVAAQTGTKLANGTLSQVADSQAVQITASVGATRSVNALHALVDPPSGPYGNIADVVSEAGIFTGFAGSGRPALQTDGNFTAVSGERYRLSDLFQASAPSGQTVAQYRVALGDGSGHLWLNDTDVSSQTTFSASDFAKLIYTVGDHGSRQDLVVVAQTGTKLPSGALIHVTDSAPVLITADVTGTRSTNAMNALVDTPSGADGAIVDIVSEASILTGFVGSVRPSVQTVGNFTAETGGNYRLSDLFQANAPTGQSIAGYRVALSDGGAGGGQLLLNGAPVNGQTRFTAAQFAQLTYQAGADGTQQNLIVVAQTGKLQPNGALTHVIDSPAIEIIASAAQSGSINADGALVLKPAGAEGDVARIASEAGILTGFGTGRPTVQTDGNFTAMAGDVFRMDDLFQARAPNGQTIAGYRVAVGNGSGQLLLNGQPVDGQTSFTPSEFDRLTYAVGSDATPQKIVVVAQTGTTLANGTLTQVTDSQAVGIAASATGTRSINALNALIGTPAGVEGDIAKIASEANIFTGFAGSGRPSLQTDGNFTAVAGSAYRLNDLFHGQAPSGQTIAGYRIAVSDAGTGGGQLLLNGQPVNGTTSFTADQFAHLTYRAGANGTQQDIVVVAQTGTRLANDVLTHITDSPVMQITATAAATGSINAMNAMVNPPTGSDASTARIASEANILTGLVGSGRPTLRTTLLPEPPVAQTDLPGLPGAYSTAGAMQSGSEFELSPYYPGAISGFQSPGVFAGINTAWTTALLLLGGKATGAFQTADDLAATSQAIKAYRTVSGF